MAERVIMRLPLPVGGMSPGALLAGTLGACGPVAPAPASPPVETPASTSEPEPEEASAPAATSEPSSPVDGRAVVLIDDAAALARLGDVGDLAGMVFGVPGATTKALRRSAEYRRFVTSLNLNQTRSSVSTFPAWWMGHPRTFFELVGVVNRLDRRDMRPGTCGEVRFVHRLAYRAEDESIEFLPVGLNVVLRQDDDGHGCRDVARSWMVPVGADPVSHLSAEGGPLRAERLGRDRLLTLESNVRRFEGWGEPGHGNNTLRVFSFENGDPEEGRLEFEPYSKQLLVSRSVARWLMAPGTFESIERGVAVLPKGWEWEQAFVSISGQPQRQGVFGTMWKRIGKDDPRVVLPSEGLLATRDGLTHRLDGMTCGGCHARRSVAGFHLPGDADAVRGGASAHLLAELDWRTAYVEAVAAGRASDDRRRLPDDGPPGFGRRCSVEGSPISTYACDSGFRCVDAPGHSFGTCLPDDYRGPAPCLEGTAGCRSPSAWFPAGFEARPCEDGLPCAAVPTPADARRCHGTSDLWECVLGRAERVVVDRCELQSDCREGYVCVDASEAGVCRPAATVPGLRIAGHRARLR